MTAGNGPWQELTAALQDSLGADFVVREAAPVAGGDINSAYRLIGDGRTLFVKLNTADRAEMLAAEAEGLAELTGANALRVPSVIGHGTARGQAFLALEHIGLVPLGDKGRERLGEGLALLHRVTAARFGWHRDNTIGTTPQPNGWFDDWVGFYRDQRLGFQLEQAAAQGHDRGLIRDGEHLCERLEAFFSDYRPVPSLLHGDLWSGNAAATEAGEPVIYDPAVYYGDRESDMAMTELFGGFGQRFRRAYEAVWPLDEGYRTRRDLYQLYHVLNHLNMFGGAFAGHARRLIQSLLAET